MEYFDTTLDVKLALGNHINVIQSLDLFKRRRSETSSIRKILLSKYPASCAYCGNSNKIEAAHIEHLELGGSSEEENIILLCHQCHRRYDSGNISINDMKKIAENWRANPNQSFSNGLIRINPVPHSAVTQPPNSVISICGEILKAQRERKYGKALRIIQRYRKNNSLDKKGDIYLAIKRAEINRRRSAKGVLEVTYQILSSINNLDVPVLYQPVYYYELNYVLRLMGQHAEARKAIQNSVISIKNLPEDSSLWVGIVAASVNELLCDMATYNKLSPKQAIKYEKKLLELAKLATKSGKYWGGRWALNCAAHIVQVHMRAESSKFTHTAFNRMRDIYLSVDTKTGWDSASYITFALIEGLVYSLFPNNNYEKVRGLQLLARAFMARLSRRQRPEGIRDCGFGLAIGLSQSRNPSERQAAAALFDVMKKTRDGTSTLWPYRTDSHGGGLFPQII